jgi:hypothetical protein
MEARIVNQRGGAFSEGIVSAYGRIDQRMSFFKLKYEKIFDICFKYSTMSLHLTFSGV